MEEDDIDIATAMGFASFGGTKKRKFDHASAPKTSGSSGANATKLGVRTKKVASTEDKTKQLEEELQPKSSTSNLDASRDRPAATGLAAFLARGQTLPDHAPGTQPADSIHIESDSATTETLSFGGPAISRAELNALRFGVKNKVGDTTFFLPSFVEDPWARLTKDNSV